MLRNWSSDQETLVESLSTNLADLIDAGFIPAGVTLPSQRELSSVLGVSRGTVAAAMTQLEQHNYLVIQKVPALESGRVEVEDQLIPAADFLPSLMLPLM